MRLKSNNGFPPGGYIFQDPLVPAAKWMDAHTSLLERIKEVIRFRQSNPQVYPPEKTQFFDTLAVGIEITLYNCARLGNDPHWCYDETKSQMNIPNTTVKPADNKCTCGAPLVERLCPTCGGRRVIGWICPACKKTY
jgi:hypothetical protein